MSVLTVAICTYRRTGILARTLQSLSDGRRPEIDWDLLVVDNDGDERVREIVLGFGDRLPIRYEHEPETGIARARNCAVRHTTAPVILFADDDVLFDLGWLCAMADAVRDRPECDLWGGRIKLDWSVERPRWFDVERCPMLGDSVVHYDLGAQSRAWRSGADPEFYTCNLGLRTDAIRQAGMFDVTLGHQGKRRGGGEDSWMVRAITGDGGRAWYVADALLYHPVPEERLSRRYARHFAWSQGRVGTEMLRREQESQRPPRWMYRHAFEQLCRGCMSWCAGNLRRDPGLAFAGQFNSVYGLSRLWHGLTRRRGEKLSY
ncbi:MAG: hypothetical protein CMJ18_18765 [Phycisphaeraceae bacterium]|nr:hypothetical protein [Phycisphaeraceae bacterium]